MNAKNRRCVVIGGAPIGKVGEAAVFIAPDDFIVACDGGLYNAEALGAHPDLIVGDFDSHPVPETEIETIRLPCEKDDTDTVFAVREAVRRGFSDFLLLGVTGGRLDHTLGNVYILYWLAERGLGGIIVDDTSELLVVGSEPVEIEDRYAFFSLLNLTGRAEGVTVTGAKYPLSDAVIDSNYQYGISNEPLPGKTAAVTVRTGRLLLIKIRHE